MKNKKIICLIFIFVLIIINLIMPSNIVEAKTLRDLKNELNQKQREYENSKSQQQLTESQIAEARKNVSAINNEINSINEEMINLTKEIEQLNVEIIEKEQEIKDIMNYYQISNGESAYLEYIFDAADFTDFIYRMAIAEQLSTHNKKLVEEYNQKIKDNEKKKIELDDKKESLNSKQKELEKELKSLKGQLSSILEENVSIEDEIDVLEEYINTYQNKYKCKLDEDISSCGRDKLPPGTKFYRPVVSGSISANYGWYSPWGDSMWHYGTDFAGTGHGANVYSVADGRVAAIMWKTSCGGNMVFVHHNVAGQTYTTGYFHLASVNVSVGQVVTYNTVVGTVGGNPGIETWDACSTGTHLHFQSAYGLYLQDYTSWSTFSSNSFDPRLIINLPDRWAWFSDRTTRY